MGIDPGTNYMGYGAAAQFSINHFLAELQRLRDRKSVV